MKKGLLYKLAFWLVVIGAINWGLTALGFNVVEMISDAVWTTLATIIYIAVGLSGLYVGYKKISK